LLAAVLAFTACQARTAATDEKSPAKEKEHKLIGVLRSDAPPPEKAMACKRLAVYGSKDAVPALAALLSNEQLASWARIALEAIPDPAADDALRESLGKLQGKLLVGAINSLSVRRDAKAVELLASRLKDADVEVASAATAALGRIGNPDAASALQQSLVDSPPAVRAAVAEGCILCAEKFLAEGNSAEAVKLYDSLLKFELPKQRALEATRGSILARGAGGVPLLIEILNSPDKSYFKLGLQTARELPGGEVTKSLMAELGRMPPERQSLVILALADRSDAKALPAMLQAAKSGPDEVRVAAIRVLERIGDRTCVPDLLDAAQESKAEIAQAAVKALANIPDEAIDGDLAGRLPQATGKARLVLIQLAGLRRIAASKATLLTAIEDSEGPTRVAAISALGEIVELDDLPVLISRATNPQKPEEAKAALLALNAACARMPDREACAEKIATALPQLSAPAKQNLLKVLCVTGGAKALQTVASAAKDSDPEIRDAASRLLGEWTTADAAPALLDLAKSAAEERIRIRALRGYLRIARQFALPEEQRIEMCRNALAAATRDEEKKMTLEVLVRYPSVGMLQIAVAAGKTPALESDASRAALMIAQKLGGKSVEVRKLLAQLGLEPVKVEIIKAEYGDETNFKDVTATLRQRVGEFPLIVLRSAKYNASFGGDPAPGKTKKLKIQYKMNDKPGEASFPENAAIVLPKPK
jgi:HEAT repeat protein